MYKYKSKQQHKNITIGQKVTNKCLLLLLLLRSSQEVRFTWGSYLRTGEVLSARSPQLAPNHQPLDQRRLSSPQSLLPPPLALLLKQPAVIRWCLKGERRAPCSRSPSATSVPLVRDSCSPGAIRSQAEGGMSPSSKSQTGWEGKRGARAREQTHPRHYTGASNRRCNSWEHYQTFGEGGEL